MTERTNSLCLYLIYWGNWCYSPEGKDLNTAPQNLLRGIIRFVQGHIVIISGAILNPWSI